ncbi:hypothetical protein [Pontitalea aquivivens]|uniref:hypothetical protein n=1 Tax=Pontitalea aquivivens TaxID=3388663 RepID=UPI003970A928
MTDKPRKTGQTPPPNGTETSREERLRAALRANLQRRKAQARARTAQLDDAADEERKED